MKYQTVLLRVVLAAAGIWLWFAAADFANDTAGTSFEAGLSAGRTHLDAYVELRQTDCDVVVDDEEIRW